MLSFKPQVKIYIYVVIEMQSLFNIISDRLGFVSMFRLFRLIYWRLQGKMMEWKQTLQILHEQNLW